MEKSYWPINQKGELDEEIFDHQFIADVFYKLIPKTRKCLATSVKKGLESQYKKVKLKRNKFNKDLDIAVLFCSKFPARKTVGNVRIHGIASNNFSNNQKIIKKIDRNLPQLFWLYYDHDDLHGLKEWAVSISDNKKQPFFVTSKTLEENFKKSPCPIDFNSLDVARVLFIFAALLPTQRERLDLLQKAVLLGNEYIKLPVNEEPLAVGSKEEILLKNFNALDQDEPKTNIISIKNENESNFITSLDNGLAEGSEENGVVRHDYNLINNVLNKFLFNGRYENKEIYLDFEKEVVSYLAIKLSKDPKQIDSKIFEIVAQQLDWGTKNPFSKLINWDEQWQSSGFNGFPPTTLFLCSLSLVAEGMRAGDRFSFNNYYDRFMIAFKISRDSDETAIKSHFKSTAKMWRNFNSWLIRNDGNFGLPTARPFMPTKPFISYPISQALIRRGDRKHIRKFLEGRGFNAAVEEDIGIVGEALGRWFKTTGPTKYLKNLWSHKSLRNIIISDAFEEIKNITSLTNHYQIGSNYRAKLRARLKFKNYPKKKILISFVAKSRDIFEQEVQLKELTQSGVFEEGAAISLIPENSEIAVLGPPNHIKTGTLFSRGASLIECDGSIGYKYQPRQAMALEKKGDGFFYQVDRPKLFVEHVILLRKKHQKQVQNFVNFAANGNQQTVEELPGLPDGYVCIIGVTFIKPISVEEWDALDVNYWLLPGENQTNLEFSGGLRLVGNIYHSKSRLSVLFQSEKEHERINVAITSVARKVTNIPTKNNVYSVKIEGGIGCHELSMSNECITDQDIEISCLSNSFSETNLSLRSASNPRRALGSKYEFENDPLDFFNVLSCSEISKGFEKTNKSDGISSNSLRTLKNDKNICQSHEFVGDFYTEGNFNEEEEDFLYSESVAGDGALSCIENDIHTWKVPEKASGTTTHTQFCTICNEKRLWVGTRNRERIDAVYALFDRPVRHFKMDQSSYDTDTIFDAMCYLGSINWDVIKRLCEEASAPNFYALNFVRQLSALGHIDIELDQSKFKLKRCHVRRPLLMESNNGFVLSGFRNKEIIAELIALIGEPVINKNEATVVKQYIFNYFDVDLENQVLAALKQTCGVECTVVRGTNRGIMENLDVTNLYSSLPPISLNNKSKFQKFDPQKCRWVDVDSIDERGGYRTQWPVTMYAIRLKNKELVVSTAALAKIYAADIKYLRLHEYNVIDRTFTSKVGCDLPPLVERALVSQTGTLPIQKTPGNLLYSNIPENMGYSILENHYGTNI